MNPLQMLNAVETCIAERTIFDCKSYVICWHEDRLKCLPTRAVKNDGNIFLQITAADCKHGLSPSQWEECCKNIAEFFERKKNNTVTQKQGNYRSAVHGPESK
jgi:hypothetical protein